MLGKFYFIDMELTRCSNPREMIIRPVEMFTIMTSPVTKRVIAFFGLFAGALVVFCGAGCSKSSSGSAGDPEAIHINKVADLVEEFKKAKNGKAPADLNELKTWGVGDGKATDDDFKSTRDKEPYVLRRMGSEVVIGEATGKDRKKYIVAPPGKAALMSEMGYQMMLNKGAPSAPKGQPQ